jgi:hypothetical protein
MGVKQSRDASRSLNSLLERWRFKQRLISRGVRPSVFRLAAYALVSS